MMESTKEKILECGEDGLRGVCLSAAGTWYSDSG